MANEVQTQVFDYTELDVTTAEILLNCENELEDALTTAAIKTGGILKKAQSALSGHRYSGTFQKWLKFINIPKTSAYEYISMYETAVRLSDVGKLDIFKSLPGKLARKISSKSSESTPEKAQAKAEVLEGKIVNAKAYEARIAELEAQALQADSACRQAEQRELDAKRSAEIANRQNERLTDELATATKPETVVVEKEVERVVEVDKTYYSAVVWR